ncbi:MAG TPA: hypothetical protein VKP30_08765 [Polyangiaceae bacterium]|nr:hypothetical protein [Polyangiaceae bacterium]
MRNVWPYEVTLGWPSRVTLRQLLSWIPVIGALVLIFAPTLRSQIAFASAPENLCDDVRIVNYYFLHFADPSLFTNDVLGRYHSEGTSELYRGIFYLVAKAGYWYAFTKYVPFVLLGVCLIGLGIAAHRLGGLAAAFVAMALCLSTQLVLGRSAGVLPRAFAFPILSLMAAALVNGRVKAIAWLTVIGAGFYPVLTVIGCLVLAIYLFLMPSDDRGTSRHWPLRRRVLLILSTAVACAVLTLPFSLRMRAYGQAIGYDDLRAFPEAGPGGRHDSVTAPPHAPLPEASTVVARNTVTGVGSSIVPSMRGAVLKNAEFLGHLRDALAYLTVIGATLYGLRRSAPMRRLAVLAAATGVGYLIAMPVAPSLVVPHRYVLYTVPIVAILCVSSFTLGFLPSSWTNQGSIEHGRRAVPLLMSGALVLGFFGGRGDPRAGLGRFIADADQPVFRAVAQLPPSALVAGWPDGTMDSLSVATHRTPFLSRELHVPYHSGMTLLLRERMYALIDAYFAGDPSPLIRLREQYGVTHLIVAPERLHSRPSYFRPFQPRITEAHAQGESRGFESLRQVERCSLFHNETRALLDLSCIRAPGS